jgi:GDP-D-mannose dehydratase
MLKKNGQKARVDYWNYWTGRSYLSEYLLSLDYEIGGFIRSSSTGHLGNVEHLRDEIKFFRWSLDDESSIEQAVEDAMDHYALVIKETIN